MNFYPDLVLNELTLPYRNITFSQNGEHFHVNEICQFTPEKKDLPMSQQADNDYGSQNNLWHM